MVLFDIDHTLLDTDKLRKCIQYKRLPALFGVSALELEKITAKYTSTLKSSIEFSPRVYVQFLVERLKLERNIQKIALEFFLNNERDFKAALFAEVLSSLERLSKEFLLGIFSEGDLEFQQAKLEKSGIKKFFKPELVFIFPSKANELKVIEGKIKNYQGPAFIVDDNIDHIRRIMDTRFIPILLDRRGKYKQFGDCLLIDDLSQLMTLAPI